MNIRIEQRKVIEHLFVLPCARGTYTDSLSLQVRPLPCSEPKSPIAIKEFDTALVSREITRCPHLATVALPSSAVQIILLLLYKRLVSRQSKPSESSSRIVVAFPAVSIETRLTDETYHPNRTMSLESKRENCKSFCACHGRAGRLA